MKYDVFISYRREGGDTLAQLLYDRLTQRGYRVFLDIESLNAGKFNEKLLDVIEECKDIVVVLPPNALDRCHNEGDWLYREIEHGIKLSKNIVPVMMKGFFWPDNIPDAISEIQHYNGIIDNKDYFDAVIDKITTLLNSKPILGGNFRMKMESRKFTLKEQIKRRKRIIAIVLIAALCCVSVFGVLHYQKEQQRLRDESYVTIKLTANEEMSASDYYDAIEILKKRFEILADGEEFTFEDEDDTIHVSIPFEVFHDAGVSDILKSSVTRPGEIYIAPAELSDKENFFHIDRSSIEDVELVTDIPVTFDVPDNYEMKGVENPDDYQYIALTLDSETAKALADWMNETNADMYYEFGDYEEIGRFEAYYGLMEVDESSDTIYFLNNCQYENFFNLAEYNYSNETFSHAFYIEMQMPVKWEDIDKPKYSLGENQCNEEDLTGPLIRLDYSTYSDEVTDGEYQDTLRIIKSRLDALGTPYAFGYRADDPNILVVKLNIQLINDQIAGLIGALNQFTIKSSFYEILDSYSIENIEILQKEDGSCCLQITPNSSWYYKKSTKEWMDAIDSSTNIYFTHNGTPFSQTTLGEAFNGESFIIDNLNSFNLDTVDAEHEYIFQLIKNIITGDTIPHTYNYEVILRENLKDGENNVPLTETVSEELQKECESVLSSIGEITDYEVTAINVGQAISIDLTLPVGGSYAENVNQILQTIYEEMDFSSGKVSNIWIYFKENMEDGNYAYFAGDDGYYVNYNLSANIYSAHSMSFSGYASDYIPEEDVAEIEKIIHSDEFYEQFYVDEYYLDDNGNIDLK